MLMRWPFVLILFAVGNPAHADVLTVRDLARGELLYSTHCIACHTEKVHWRDKKIAKDYLGLRAEVRRWQKLSALRWSSEDISDVARYLNTLYYRFPSSY